MITIRKLFTQINGSKPFIYPVSTNFIKRFKSNQQETQAPAKHITPGPYNGKQVIRDLIQKQKLITKLEWNDIRKDFLQNANQRNGNDVDSQIIKICSENSNALENALTYLDWLKEVKVSLNLASSTGLLHIYWQHRGKLTSDDINRLENM